MAFVKGRETMSSNRIDELNDQISELKRNWPKHSVPPGLIRQLDDLEAELELELNKPGNPQTNTAADTDD